MTGDRVDTHAPAGPTGRWQRAPLWADGLRPLPSSASPAALAGRSVDVVVVGAGLAGLVTASVLARAGHGVVVVERHDVGGVTSRGSTGKLSALQGGLLASIAEQQGADAAATYAEASLLGVAGLRRLVEDLDIDCSLLDVTDVTYATEPEAAERCAALLVTAGDAGLPVRWIADLDLPFPTLGGVALDHQACLDPGALCAGLSERLPAGSVLEGHAVRDVHEHADEVAVTLDDGTELSAAHVVIATMGPFHDPAMLSTRCEPVRSYGVAAPVEVPPSTSSISLDEHSRSIRPATIDGRPAVVVVGEGHAVGDDSGRGSADRWAALGAFCTDQLGTGPVERHWVAHDLVPSDGVPFIGRLAPGAERRWVASGFQKWGISTAFVAADLLHAEIEGRSRPWSQLFDPRRLASSANATLARNAVRTVRHFVGDRVADLAPGHDARPRCTHLGCVLDFDEAERTWDCPCHGSRYDETGQVVSGPAATALDLPTASS